MAGSGLAISHATAQVRASADSGPEMTPAQTVFQVYARERVGEVTAPVVEADSRNGLTAVHCLTGLATMPTSRCVISRPIGRERCNWRIVRAVLAANVYTLLNAAQGPSARRVGRLRACWSAPPAQTSCSQVKHQPVPRVSTRQEVSREGQLVIALTRGH